MGKIKQQKGFTLAELLVVVAIIGVLVAVAIPVFSNQLEKSRDAVTVANLRNAYAEAQTAYLTETSSPDGRVEYNDKYPWNIDVDKMVVVKDFKPKGKKKNDFSGLVDNLPFKKEFHSVMENLDNGAGKTYRIEFLYNDNGELSVVQLFEQQH